MITLNKEKKEEVTAECVTQSMKDEILGIINKYQLVSKEQIAAILGSEELAGKIISSLSDHRKIFTTEEGYLPHLSLVDKVSDLIIYKKILWLMIALKDKLDIDDIILQACNSNFMYGIFLAKNELFDILYIPTGSESLFNMYFKAQDRGLSEEDKKEIHRIIMLDKKEQKSKIDVSQVNLYTVVTKDGNVEYI